MRVEYEAHSSRVKRAEHWGKVGACRSSITPSATSLSPEQLEHEVNRSSNYHDEDRSFMSRCPVCPFLHGLGRSAESNNHQHHPGGDEAIKQHPSESWP